MQRREDDTNDHQRNGYLPQKLQYPLEDRTTEERMFQNHRRELEGEHRQVEHHADGNFEQHRVVLPVDHGMPDIPRQTQVVEESHRDGEVAQQGGQDRRTHTRSVFLETKDVHGRGHDESAGSKRNSRHHVESDPQTPRRRIRQVRDRAEPPGEPDNRDSRQNPHRCPQERFKDRQSIKHWSLHPLVSSGSQHRHLHRKQGSQDRRPRSSLHHRPSRQASCGD